MVKQIKRKCNSCCNDGNVNNISINFGTTTESSYNASNSNEVRELTSKEVPQLKPVYNTEQKAIDVPIVLKPVLNNDGRVDLTQNTSALQHTGTGNTTDLIEQSGIAQPKREYTNTTERITMNRSGQLEWISRIIT